MERKNDCFDVRFLGACVAWALLIIAAALVSRAWPRGSAGRIACAVVEAVATGAVILMTMRRMRLLDEMQRRIHLEALALAFFGTGALGAGYGFLEHAGLPSIDWGAVIWPVMVGLWAGGMWIASRRYR